MSKTALLFAGQGAQHVGMGMDLCRNFPVAKSLFHQANSIMGFDLARLCFEGPEADLTRTEFSQPAIYLVGWTAWQLLRDSVPELKVEASAGLSLGEFTALASAGCMTFEEGLAIVRQRGRLMQQACLHTQGAMAAILNLDEPTTRDVCLKAGVDIANLNCPGQIVISGPSDGIARACDLAKSKGAKRALLLPVAGAFHSRLMSSAQPALSSALNSLSLSPARFPVLSNVTAAPHGTSLDTITRLVEQVCAPVRWEESVRWLLAQGFSRFIELGPGTTLSAFMKRIDPRAHVLNINDSASLKATIAAIRA